MTSDREPILRVVETKYEELADPVHSCDMYGSTDNTNNSCNMKIENSFISDFHNMEKYNKVTKPVCMSDLINTTIDDVLNSIGQFGRYQKYQYFLLCLVSVVAAFQAFNMVFIGDTPAHHCTVPVDASKYNMTEEELLNHTIPWEPCSGCTSGSQQRSQCSMYNLTVLGYEPSNHVSSGRTFRQIRATTPTTECIYGWSYSSLYYTSTIVSQWDLVCDDSFLRGLADTVFFTGRLGGAVIFGAVSDKFGRQIGLISAVIPQVVVSIGAACTKHYVTFLILYFIQGATQVGIMFSSFVWATEIVGTSKRKVAAMGHKLSYSVGAMLLSAIAYGFRDWRALELAISLPSLFFISYKCLIPESARWLLSHNREDEAKQILYRTAKFNGRSKDTHLIENLSYVPVANGSFSGLFKRYKLAKITLCLWTVWLVNQMVYSGLSLNSKMLSGDPYLNFFLTSVVEVPAILLALVIVDRVGRKPCVCGGLLAASVFCLAAGFIPPEYTTAQVVVSLSGKCAITHAFSVVFLLTAEVFPTTFRNVGVGTSAMCGHIGGTLSAVFIALSEFYRPLPYLIFGVLCLLGTVAVFFVPETLGKQLPQTLDDMEQSASVSTISSGIVNQNYSGDNESSI